jgi:predicted phage tail protein
MIKFYGYLAKKYGKEAKIKVNSVPEMMKALEANFNGFKSDIDELRGYVIRRGNTFKTGIDVGSEEIEMNFGETTWHILPLPIGYGGKGGGIFKIVLGAILIALSFVPAFAAFSGVMMKLGAGMVLGGLAAILAPAPIVQDYSDREEPDKKPSYLFDGPVNRTASGGAVPLIYGRDVFVGSVFVSGGLEIGDIA